MTTEQFNAILFGFVSHISYKGKHISVYESTNFSPTITVKEFTKRRDMLDTDKVIRVFYFMGRAYRSKERLCKAIDEYQKNK